ncbi:potassium channel subfamily K member 3-like [Tropilaelaps mercedesae]|uniref:Potassium channel subfamily K member 3-like n=1 Tax=Tropilaelaps mercedesae TaxID=418985 RepID=A0A1V9XX04_9ACAR|nr:potassium channel subfamily K member 3-like [Tropilaelaps mercedesae]
MLFVASYIFLGALIFSGWEGWRLLDGAYFCFITLSTIGFGDFVPGQSTFGFDPTNNTLQDKDAQAKLIICCLYLILGLAIIAMSFNLVQEETSSQNHHVNNHGTHQQHQQILLAAQQRSPTHAQNVYASAAVAYQQRRASHVSPTRQPLLTPSGTPALSATSLNVPNGIGAVPMMCVPISPVAYGLTPSPVNGAGPDQLLTVVVADERGVRQPHVEVLPENVQSSPVARESIDAPDGTYRTYGSLKLNSQGQAAPNVAVAAKTQRRRSMWSIRRPIKRRPSHPSM